MRQDLHNESELLATLIDQFPNGVVTLFDQDHRYLVAGGTGFADADHDPADLEGNRLQDVFPAGNVRVLAPLYDRALDGECCVTEVEYESRIFRIHVVPVRDADGDVFAGMTMSQDVTEHRRHEEALEAAQERYQTILHASPDPVFIADTDTGRIVEVNDAAVEFRNQPRNEIIGIHQSALHPPDHDDTYRELFEEHTRTGGTRRRLPNGDPIYAVSADGERTPVAISVGTIDLPDASYILGVFRDVSDQLAHEQTLTGLTTATRDLFTADSQHEVATEVVRVVTEVLDMAGAGVYLFDETAGVLRAVRYELPGDLPSEPSIPETFDPGESIAWRVFSTGQPEVLDDVRTDDAAFNQHSDLRSEIVYPLGEWGVLLVSESRVGAFGSRERELVEILGTTATAALDRATRYAELREREQELAARTAALERAERLNTQIRDIVDVLVNAPTRTAVMEAVCRKLVEAAPIEFAWIGTIDHGTGRVEPQTWAGPHGSYLESANWDITDGSGGATGAERAGDATGANGDADVEPAVAVAQSGTPSVVRNTARGLTRTSWRNAALTRGFRSVMSVPLDYHGLNQGVLTVYADQQDAFAESTQPVLAELGELIAHALASIDRKQALLSNQATELEFAVHDQGCFFMRSAKQTNCSLELEGLLPEPDESLVATVRILNDRVDEFVEYAEAATIVESVTQVRGSDGTLLQLGFRQPIFASLWAEQGIMIRQITADTDGCTMTVAVPPTHDLRQVVDVVTTMFPDSEFIAKRERVGAFENPARDGPDPLDALTARQFETLELAFERGYFESPRGTSSEAVATELGISTSAFHQHIRTAEQKLVDALLADNDR